MIKKLDLFGLRLSFKSNIGSETYQTYLGSFISILFVIASFSFGVFSFTKLINRTESTIVSRIVNSNEVSIKDFHSYPFLFRFTLSGMKYIDNPETVWSLTPVLFTYDPAKSKSFLTSNLKYSPCKEEYFPGHSKVLSEISDLNTYFCIDYQGSNIESLDLNGPYGGKEYYNFLFFKYRSCVQEYESSVKCKSSKEINDILREVYMDVRVLHTDIDHNQVDPRIDSLYGLRIPISNTIFTRISLIIQSMTYTSDFGYIFTEFDSIQLNQFMTYTTSNDLRRFEDVKDKDNYNVFMQLVFINSSMKYEYTRTFLKAQVLLANVGGIIKGLGVICSLFLYILTKKDFDLYLVNEILAKSKEIEKEKQDETIKSNMKLNNFVVSKKSLVDSKVKLSLLEKVLPFCCFYDRKKRKIIEMHVKAGYEMLSIENYIEINKEFEVFRLANKSSNENFSFSRKSFFLKKQSVNVNNKENKENKKSFKYSNKEILEKR